MAGILASVAAASDSRGSIATTEGMPSIRGCLTLKLPVVTVAMQAEPQRITEVAAAVLEHFGVAVPEPMEASAGVR